MKKFQLVLYLIVPFSIFAQQKQNIYWVENNLQIHFKDSLEITSHDSLAFHATTADFKLSIWKQEIFLTKDEMEDQLLTHIISKGYTVSGKIISQYGNFLRTVYCQAKNKDYWGVFFLLKEELNNDDIFLGYITTGTKPTTEVLRLVESFKVIEEGSLTSANYANDTKQANENNTTIQDELMGLLQKYSPEIFSYADYYYKMPSELNGVKLNKPYSLSSYFPDSIPYRTLYKKSGFVYNMISDLNSKLSTVAAFESANKTGNQDFFSFMPVMGNRIDLIKIQIPPASIINRSFPQKFISSNYADIIYPSTLNYTTQLNGIFGLECLFIATCYEINWYNSFLSFYSEKEMNNAVFYLEYLYSFPNHCYNALSIKHYIIKYLSVLQTEMADSYLKLNNNVDFRNIISTYFALFDRFIHDFNTNKLKIREEIGNQYLPFMEDESKLRIDELQYTNNDGLVLFNSLVDFIDNEPGYKKTIADFDIPQGQKILIVKE